MQVCEPKMLAYDIPNFKYIKNEFRFYHSVFEPLLENPYWIATLYSVADLKSLSLAGLLVIFHVIVLFIHDFYVFCHLLVVFVYDNILHYHHTI